LVEIGRLSFFFLTSQLLHLSYIDIVDKKIFVFCIKQQHCYCSFRKNYL